MCRIFRLLINTFSGILLHNIFMTPTFFFFFDVMLITLHPAENVLCHIWQGFGSLSQKGNTQECWQGWVLERGRSQRDLSVPWFLCWEKQLRALRYISIKWWRKRWSLRFRSTQFYYSIIRFYCNYRIEMKPRDANSEHTEWNISLRCDSWSCRHV